MSMPEQNKLETLETQLKHLQHENYILLEQIKVKNSILELLMEEQDLVFASVDKDLTIEFIRGRGLESFNVQPIDVLGRDIHDALSAVPALIDFIKEAMSGKTLAKELDLGFSKVFNVRAYPQFDEEDNLNRVFLLAF